MLQIPAASQPARAPAARALPTTPPQKYPNPDCSPASPGDTTRNLVWRLEHGEGPERLRPAVVVLQIGTNDLTQPEHPLARAALAAHPRSAHETSCLPRWDPFLVDCLHCTGLTGSDAVSAAIAAGCIADDRGHLQA